MKNSRLSDNELAGILGVSQPTISRNRKQLEKDGHIREHAAMPEFAKLGYHIIAITLYKYDTSVEGRRVKNAREKAKKIVKESPPEMVLAARGIGIGYDEVTISFHKDYTPYVRFKDLARQLYPIALAKMESFLVDLDDEIRYKPLTVSTLAEHQLKLDEEEDAVDV